MTNVILTRLSGLQLRDYYESGFWQGETIYQIARRHAATQPDKPAVRDRFQRHSYRSLVALADRMAASLAAAGLRSGDRVAVWLPNRVETVAALLACARNRYICCPSLHRSHATMEIVALLEQIRASALIVEPGFGADGTRNSIVARAEAISTLRAVFPLAPATAERDEPSWLLPEQQAVQEAPPPGDDPDSILYLAFTSGTTGQPKGVLHSDNTLLANACAVASDWGLDARSVIYTLSPLSHNLGFGSMMTALLLGGELVLHDIPNTAGIVERIRETGATYLVGVPTHAIDIVRELDASPERDLRQLKGFRISGAPAPRSVVEKLLQHGVTPQSGYGMTEAGSHHYTRPTDSAEMITGSSGQVCPGYEVKIWSNDDPDKEVPPRTVGQVGGRGASLMLGYFDDQEATERSFNRAGWFMTGDLGWVDEQGYIRITGRKKDVIIRGGHNIYPARIEALVMRHPAIELAAVVPVADDRLGEKVCVVFLRRKNHRMTPVELLTHLDAEGLSRFDMPEYVIEVAHMPTTASGKVLKRALVDLIQAGRLVPLPVRWTQDNIVAMTPTGRGPNALSPRSAKD